MRKEGLLSFSNAQEEIFAGDMGAQVIFNAAPTGSFGSSGGLSRRPKYRFERVKLAKF